MATVRVTVTLPEEQLQAIRRVVAGGDVTDQERAWAESVLSVGVHGQRPSAA